MPPLQVFVATATSSSPRIVTGSIDSCREGQTFSSFSPLTAAARRIVAITRWDDIHYSNGRGQLKRQTGTFVRKNRAKNKTKQDI